MQEHGAVPGQGVKFPVLAAGIHPGGQGSQEGRAEFMTTKPGVQLARIQGADPGLEPGVDHRLRQLGRVAAPEREERRDAGPRQLPLPIGAHILKKEIPERHVVNVLDLHIGDEARHDAPILLVAAGPGQVDGDQRQAHALSLCQQQLLAHPVHGHPLERLVEGGEQPHHLDGRILAQAMQGPGAVFSAAPGEQYLFLRHDLSSYLPHRAARQCCELCDLHCGTQKHTLVGERIPAAHRGE